MVLSTLSSDPVTGAYVVLMALSALSFLVLSRVWDDVPTVFFLVHFFVVVWSGLVYLTDLSGNGIHEIIGIEAVGTFLYFDWIISTPLMVLALGLSAIYKSDREFGLVVGAAGLQGLVIVAGLLADLTELTWLFFVVSIFFYIPLFAILWGPLREIANESGARGYSFVLGFISLMWVVYPMVWVLGPVWSEMLSMTDWMFLFTVVPAFTKSFFGFLDLWVLNLENSVEDNVFEV